MIPIVTPQEMAAVDAAAPEPVEALIERAGAAVAWAARRMLGGTYGRTVTIVAGKGNNGNDGRAAASVLARWGVHVRVVEATDCPSTLPSCDLVIDAAYGTGFRGEWWAPRVGSTPVLAVDIPSGVDGATGTAGRGVLAADRTVTFQGLKPGLLFGPGRWLAGEVDVADIGLDVSATMAHLVGHDDVAQWWRPRPPTAHKWSRAVRIVAGSRGMTGSAHLAAAAAQRAGAGMVTLSSPGIDPVAPLEVVGRRLPASDWATTVLDDLDRYHALVIGPGLGREEHTVAQVRKAVLEAAVPVVVDGDGLFALAWSDDGAAALLRRRDAPTVLTPHEGEHGLLTGRKPAADRILATRRLAAATHSIVLLKGPTTVVAAPDGDVRVVTASDARMATAGTGDVLSG
ncbi:MAG: NAD(P)H-hydrate dehydratase, partial [Actinomycetota bacterium]|nr:NAD(P)H-hydrate dehydratase [Actinomycetota bacterium]